MKKILSVLSIVLFFTSCSAIMGINYANLTKELDLGMTKHEVINILGTDYYVESLSQTEEGKEEVLTFGQPSGSQEFTLHFINDKLVRLNKYIPTYQAQDIFVLQ